MTRPGVDAPPVSIDNLSIRYGTRLVIGDLSMEVPAGSVYALIGRHGTGKTSLIRCLAGVQKPSRGVVRVFGQDSWRSRVRALARVGLVPEELDLPADMSTGELSSFCGRVFPAWDSSGFTGRCNRWSLTPSLPFEHLSRGERRLVSLAVALGGRPDLLILDDPTSGLDPIARSWLQDELIRELADRQSTILLATHDMDFAERVATHVTLLGVGTMQIHDTMEALKGRFWRVHLPGTQPAHTMEETIVRNAHVVRIMRHGPGMDLVVRDDLEAALHALRAAALEPEGEAEHLSLEQVFLALCGNEKEDAR